MLSQCHCTAFHCYTVEMSYVRSYQSLPTLPLIMGFPGGSVVKNLPASAGDTGSIPESGTSPGKENGSPLQYSCLENPIDKILVGYSPWGCKRVRHDIATKQQKQPLITDNCYKCVLCFPCHNWAWVTPLSWRVFAWTLPLLLEETAPPLTVFPTLEWLEEGRGGSLRIPFQLLHDLLNFPSLLQLPWLDDEPWDFPVPLLSHPSVASTGPSCWLLKSCSLRFFSTSPFIVPKPMWCTKLQMLLRMTKPWDPKKVSRQRTLFPTTFKLHHFNSMGFGGEWLGSNANFSTHLLHILDKAS